MRLELQNISHRYGALDVIESVSFCVEQGEIVGIIGPSGCGKSTLLNIIGGLLKPTSGRVLADGARPAGCLNPLTYVFQDFSLLPWRTVAGNIELALEPHRLGAQAMRRRVDAVLARMLLTDFRDAYPKQLSGGMRQRVGIARALAVEPAVLLMDEPLSALDAQTRLLLTDEFAALFARGGTTVVYVTHNLAEAVQLCDRVVVLSRRPGLIKDILSLRRGADDARRAQDVARLWSLIRDDAAAADRELIDAG